MEDCHNKGGSKEEAANGRPCIGIVVALWWGVIITSEEHQDNNNRRGSEIH